VGRAMEHNMVPGLVVVSAFDACGEGCFVYVVQPGALGASVGSAPGVGAEWLLPPLGASEAEKNFLQYIGVSYFPIDTNPDRGQDPVSYIEIPLYVDSIGVLV